MKKVLLIIIVLVIDISQVCSQDKIINVPEIAEITVDLTQYGQYIMQGNTDFTNSGKFYFTDYREEKVVVLDIFSLSEGIKKIGRGFGKGPGEHTALVGNIALNDTLYLSDRSLNKISIYKDETYIEDFPIETPFNLLANYVAINEKHRKLYVSSDQLYEQGFVHEFDIDIRRYTGNSIQLPYKNMEGIIVTDMDVLSVGDIVVMSPYREPFMYIYTILDKSLKKIRVSDHYEKNSVILKKSFLGGKTYELEFADYIIIESAMDDDYIYLGISEKKYGFFKTIKIYNHEGDLIDILNLDDWYYSLDVNDTYLHIGKWNEKKEILDLYFINKKDILKE